MVQFPTHRVLHGGPDLTALQQTHSLGNFHHRFHPTRQNFQFGVNPSQVAFPPQTHIVPPQPIHNHHHHHQQQQQQQQQQQHLINHQLQNQRSLQHSSFLRPTGQFQHGQQVGLVPSQEFHSSHSNFKSLPAASKVPNAFGSFQDQYIKNSFPSNAPHTIKFSISSQNYNPNQAKHFANPATPQPKINHQLTSSLSQNRFPLGPSLPPSHSLISNFPNNNFQIQSNQNNLQNFNIHQQKPLTSDSSSQFNNNFIQSNFNLRGQQTNDLIGSTFGRQPDDHVNVDLHPKDQKTHLNFGQNSFIQSSIELRQDEFLQQQKFNQQPLQQSHQTTFSYPVETQPPRTQTTATPRFELQPTEQQQQTKFIQQTAQTYLQQRTTESPRLIQTEATRSLEFSPTVKPLTMSFPDSSGRKLVLQKSQDQLQFALNSNYVSSQPSNDIPSSASPAAETTSATITTTTTTYKKPKPIVKEIRINLSDHINTGDDTPSQLYIKEDRLKEFQAIKAKDQKEQPKGKKEKSQEEIINEQIHKLLQSHNLEIIGKDSESQTNSQEVQLSKVSEQFKKFNYSVQLLNGGGLLSDVKQKQKHKAQKINLPQLPELPQLPDDIKQKYDIKVINKEDLLKQFDISGDHNFGNGSSNLFLADGKQLELVKFSKDGIMDKIPIGTKNSEAAESTTTAKPPKVLFEELTKSVIPPGANFELIRHKGDGQVEKVDGFSNEKKVTFVFLEEQPDGSVKIQGVKGNTDEEAEENEDVDSLIKKIKNGSLKLPPSPRQASKIPLKNEVPRFPSSTTHRNLVDVQTAVSMTHDSRPVQEFRSSSTYKKKGVSEEGPTTEFTYSSPYSIDLDSKFYDTTPEPPTTFLPTLNYIRSSTRKPTGKFRSNYDFLPTKVPESSFTPTYGSRRVKSTTPSSWYKDTDGAASVQQSKTGKPYEKGQDVSDDGDGEILSHRSTEYRGQRLRVPQDVIAQESNIAPVKPLNDVLKENGFNEMARLLDQSGLNTILNETGPYTIFVPTDKAFKALETQLGGPEKAEDKFRENPRLLSGLLLHHVVPGSFRVEDLQDEMTGVSLAGTQLRVNTYTSEGQRSKDSDVVTINGAKISNEKRDLIVPRGVAHSVDKVLFPLPIGDVIQTLKSDREKRFTKFLKSLEYSGLTDMLTGTKTYTVFAPTDKAFSVLTDSELEKLLTRREAAKTIALRHIIPGTLYTAGMHYFQIKDSMETGQKITIKKELGKIKVNSAQIVSANIPATNGIIHVIETLL
ncbi:hypothetical protein RUM44_003300 [Polyplax serrata]|uniref:FAS1 domain-containing protein n=1 Tax=Polyplax serrata TaxID=468196 RepID=A0ABR1AG68_POLSC